MSNSCFRCAHLRRSLAPNYRDDWEGQRAECRARPGMENLKGFPFLKTKCTRFKEYVPMTPNQDQHIELKETAKTYKCERQINELLRRACQVVYEGRSMKPNTLEVKSSIMSGDSMREVCSGYGVTFEFVTAICRSASIATPRHRKLVASEIVEICESAKSVRLASIKYGVPRGEIVSALRGTHQNAPLSVAGRADLSKNFVCFLHDFNPPQTTPPHVWKGIRLGSVRSDVTSAPFSLPDYPDLWLYVLDMLHGLFAGGPWADERIVSDIAKTCKVSYLDVWRVAVELTNWPPTTAAWIGERAACLYAPQFAVAPIPTEYYDLTDGERAVLISAHANCKFLISEQFWVPVDVWYRMGFHGTRFVPNYPRKRPLPERSEFRAVPKIKHLFADPLGRIHPTRGRPYRRTLVDGKPVVRVRGECLDVARIVYEAWHGAVLPHTKRVEHLNDEPRDCRPENLITSAFGRVVKSAR